MKSTTSKCDLSICCVWPLECGYFFHCEMEGLQPLAGTDRGYFFHFEVVGLQPLTGNCSIIFAQLLDSEGMYVPRYIHMTFFIINLALHINSLVSQR